MIIRVYEAGGHDTQGAAISIHGKVLSAHEANLMEDAGAKLKVERDVLRFDLRRFEIKTFKVRLQELKNTIKS